MTVTHFIPPGGSAAGDRLATLVNTPVAVSGATTAVINKHHDCTGASAYTVTLPAVSGNTGKYLSFLGNQDAGIVITIDGASAETINDYANLPLLKGAYLELYCDGTDWWVVSPGDLVVAAIVAVNVAAVSFPDGTFLTGKDYTVEGSDIVPRTDNTTLACRLYVAGAFQSGASDYHYLYSAQRTGSVTPVVVGDLTNSSIQLTPADANFLLGNASGEAATMFLSIRNPGGTSYYKPIDCRVAYMTNITQAAFCNSGGAYVGVTSGSPLAAITGIEFFMLNGANMDGVFVVRERRR